LRRSVHRRPPEYSLVLLGLRAPDRWNRASDRITNADVPDSPAPRRSWTSPGAEQRLPGRTGLRTRRSRRTPECREGKLLTMTTAPPAPREDILIDSTGGILTVTFNRPD